MSSPIRESQVSPVPTGSGSGLLLGADRGCVRATARSAGQRHQARSGDRSRGAAGPGAPPLGPVRRLRAGPEPGVRLPVPDGPVLLGGRPALLAGVGGPAVWWAGLLLAAFLGFVALCRELGLGSQGAASSAGSPSPCHPDPDTLGPISVEAWPSALAPWVLVPLVAGVVAGPPGRAAFSAFAVGRWAGSTPRRPSRSCRSARCGCSPGSPGRVDATMLIWWPTLVAVACAWWVVPLLLLGRYSPPFLDYIETSAVTTLPTTSSTCARNLALGPVRRPHVAGRQRPDSNGFSALNSGVLLRSASSG